MKLAKKFWNTVASEPAVVVGVVVAALNTATDKTWKGYAVAAGFALLRFLVSPANAVVSKAEHHQAVASAHRHGMAAAARKMGDGSDLPGAPQ